MKKQTEDKPEFGLSPIDPTFLEIKRLTREHIYRAFRVPEEYWTNPDQNWFQETIERAEAAEARAAECEENVSEVAKTIAEVMQENIKLQAWARAWKKCARRYHDKANIVICTYCGHEGQKDKAAMVEHMSVCEKRPDREDWETLREAIAKNTTIDELEAEVEQLAIQNNALRATLIAAKSALQSYAYGNQSIALAQEVVIRVDEIFKDL